MSSKEELQRSLLDANGIREEDLAENRQGRIATSQVLPMVSSALNMWTVLALLILPPWVWLSMRVLVSGESPLFAILWAVAGVYLGLNFGAIRRLVNLFHDVRAGVAMCVEGRLSTSVSYETVHRYESLNHGLLGGSGPPYIKHAESVQSYWYVIGDDSFAVTRQGFEALHPFSGSTCKVYLTPRSRFLLSLEPVAVRVSTSERVRRYA